ncbi:hypothetical protein A4U88_3548 [Serratia marcescens]|nr:hypothetical protein A4U88_3548 [Serratia marcescens]
MQAGTAQGGVGKKYIRRVSCRLIETASMGKCDPNLNQKPVARAALTPAKQV